MSEELDEDEDDELDEMMADAIDEAIELVAKDNRRRLVGINEREDGTFIEILLEQEGLARLSFTPGFLIDESGKVIPYHDEDSEEYLN